MIRLIVPGKPCGKGRPRFARMGVHVRTYTPEKTVSAETLIRELYAHSFGSRPPMIGGVRMFVRGYFPIPTSTPKKRAAKMALECVPYCHKPDADNIGKLAADALNGVAYRDDSQIFRMEVLKWYSARPRLEIYIDEVPELPAAAKSLNPDPSGNLK